MFLVLLNTLTFITSGGGEAPFSPKGGGGGGGPWPPLVDAHGPCTVMIL